MEDDIDQRVLKLITTPKNRSAALRIGRVRDLLLKDMLREFWDKGEAYLKKKRADEKLTYWSIYRTGDANPFQRFYAIRMVGKGVDKNKPHPEFLFVQYMDKNLFRWEWLVHFDETTSKIEKIKALPEAQKLAEVMDETFSMPKKRGSDGYFLFTNDSKGIERTLEDEFAKEADVSEFFEAGWKRFQGLEPYLRRLTNAVLRITT